MDENTSHLPGSALPFLVNFLVDGIRQRLRAEEWRLYRAPTYAIFPLTATPKQYPQVTRAPKYSRLFFPSRRSLCSDNEHPDRCQEASP
jgi:hypothetical protein